MLLMRRCFWWRKNRELYSYFWWYVDVDDGGYADWFVCRRAFVTGHVLVVDGGMVASGTEQRAFVTK